MSEEYNADELQFPPWLNEEFFTEMLSKDGDKIEISELNLKPGSKLGDHYASVMYRAVIDYKKNGDKTTNSFIVKAMPFLEGEKKETLSQSGFFPVEIKMYQTFIPKFEQQLHDAGDKTTFGGKCLYAALEPHNALVFEDLTLREYCTVDTWAGNFEVCMKAMDKLARWHAVSYKMGAEADSEIKEFDKHFFCMDFVWESPFFKGNVELFMEMLQDNEELEKYIPHFEKLFKRDPVTALQGLIADGQKSKAKIMVLNHGDFHIKNLMFTKKADGSSDDVILVDYQLCNWGSAVMDLMYMLYMMLDVESRVTRRNEVIYTYFKTFSTTLDNLGFKGVKPTLKDLYSDFLLFQDFEIFMLIFFLPFVTKAADKDCKFDPEKAMQNPEMKKEFFTNPALIDQYKQSMDFYLHSGYLE